MSSPTISVIIPAWNASATIRRAIDSVLAQTIFVNEVLVVDDGSSDDLAHALLGYPPQVRLVRRENGGAAAARNHGIDMATGEWLAFLDADDVWLPERLELQFTAISLEPEIRFVSGRYLLRTIDGKEIEEGPPPALTGRPIRVHSEDAFRLSTTTWTGTVLVLRELVGSARFRTDLTTAEDLEFWLRMLLKCKALVVPEPIAVHIVREGSLSRRNIDEDSRNMLTVIEMNYDLLGPAAARRWIANTHQRNAAVHLSQGNRSAAMSSAWQSIRCRQLQFTAWYTLVRSFVSFSKP